MRWLRHCWRSRDSLTRRADRRMRIIITALCFALRCFIGKGGRASAVVPPLNAPRCRRGRFTGVRAVRNEKIRADQKRSAPTSIYSVTVGADSLFRSARKLLLNIRRKIALIVASIQLARTGNFHAVVMHLFPVCNPAHGTRHREDHGKHGRRNAHRFQNDA